METEYLIQEALANLMEGRTSFVIAHRLRTAQRADLVVVLEHGKIIQQGTHDESHSRRKASIGRPTRCSWKMRIAAMAASSGQVGGAEEVVNS